MDLAELESPSLPRSFPSPKEIHFKFSKAESDSNHPGRSGRAQPGLVGEKLEKTSRRNGLVKWTGKLEVGEEL